MGPQATCDAGVVLPDPHNETAPIRTTGDAANWVRLDGREARLVVAMLAVDHRSKVYRSR
jgi:hypothetical protein